MHKKDLQSIIDQLNKRIDQLEDLVNTGLKALDTNIGIAVLGHNHIAPQASSGAIATGPGVPTGPVPASVPIVTKPLGVKAVAESKAEPILNKRLGEEIGKGPATAPLSDGFSLQEINANSTSVSNIAVGEAGGELL